MRQLLYHGNEVSFDWYQYGLFTGSYCPSGWFDVVGYGCNSIGRGSMNWNDAKAYCEGHGAHLATMETAEENECLKKL